jgi:cytochrome c oxidase subunit 4
MCERVTPKLTYFSVGAALLMLTVVTYQVALINLGPWSTVVTLGIATSKALLIVLFFMHARYSTGLTWLVIVAAVAWLALLLVGTMDDFVTRSWLPVLGD